MAMIPYDERLEHLVTAAAQVFAAKGFHSTTMRDLARETSMSLAGMYHYVRGKDEILFLIQDRCFHQVLDGAEDAVAQGTDPSDRLERFIRHHVTFFAEHMAEMKILSHEAESVSVKHKRAIDALKQRYVNLLLELLDERTDDAALAIDRRVAAYGLFGMMNWMYNWYDPTGSVSPKDLADQFSRLYLHGVAPSPAGSDQLTPTPTERYVT